MTTGDDGGGPGQQPRRSGVQGDRVADQVVACLRDGDGVGESDSECAAQDTGPAQERRAAVVGRAQRSGEAAGGVAQASGGAVSVRVRGSPGGAPLLRRRIV